MTTQTTMADLLKQNDENLEYQIDSAKKLHEKRKEFIAATWQFLQEAESEGLKLDVPSSFWGLTDTKWEISEPEQWRVIHKLVGKLKNAGTEAVEDAPARSQLVWCILSPVDPKWEHLKFKYQRKLKKGSKCRVKRVKVKGYSYSSVVCE